PRTRPSASRRRSAATSSPASAASSACTRSRATPRSRTSTCRPRGRLGRLDGKVVVITGAASGIGREAALLFSAEGASVCVADVGREAGEKTASECRDAFFFAADVSSAASVQAMYAETEKRYGRVDVLYNNAGNMPSD